jgi:hypothetical protein
MKTSELKPMTFYGRGTARDATKGIMTTVLVLDNHYWWMDRNHKVGKGRKAVTGWNEYVYCGVPVMLPNRLHIDSNTQWTLHFINPSCLFIEMDDTQLEYQERMRDEATVKQQKEEAARLLRDKAFDELTGVLLAAGLDYGTPYTGTFQFSGTAQMEGLLTFIKEAHEAREELKDLLYELED